MTAVKPSFSQNPYHPRKIDTLADRATRWIGSVSSIIIHTLVFVVSFGFWLLGVHIDTILLFLTTAVSLEAIYLAIFIQMTVNRSVKSLREVELDIDAIQEDVGTMEQDITEIQEDIDKLEADESTAMSYRLGNKETLQSLSGRLQKLSADLETLKRYKQ